MNIYYLIAAGISLLTFFIHLIVGGRMFLRPLKRSSLGLVTKVTLEFVWHMVTILLFFMTIGFLWAAWKADMTMAFFLTVLATAIGALNLGYAQAHSLGPNKLPQWLLFLAIAIFGIIGLIVATNA